VALFSPKARILLYLLLVIAVFVSDSLKVSLIILLVVLASAVRVPLSSLKRGLFPITVFLFFTFISNVLFQEGNVLYDVIGLSITDEGLRRAGRLTLRLIILITGAKVLTASTRPEDLINNMSELLGPVGRIGFVRELVYIMSLTLRLLPVIYNEAIELYKHMRGSAGSGVADKIKLSVELLTTLFERSLVKAKEMTDIEETPMPENGEKDG
jgi:energy-coupling factor transport system permease protein